MKRQALDAYIGVRITDSDRASLESEATTQFLDVADIVRAAIRDYLAAKAGAAAGNSHSRRPKRRSLKAA